MRSLSNSLVSDFFGVLGVICLVGILHSPIALAADQIVILGDGNAWQVKHHGLDSHMFLGANAEKSPCASVAAALESACLTNRIEFDAFFSNLNSEPRRQWAGHLFKEWQSESKEYSHLIVDEAVVTADGAKGAKPNVAAVSVVPFVPNAQKPNLVAIPGLRPTALLLTNVSNEWKITAGVQGEPVLRYLAKEAVRFMDPDAFVQETARHGAEMLEANNLLQRQLGALKRGGHPATLANAAREQFEFQNKGVIITNWAGWKEYFNCQELIPPVIYDVRDTWKPDFSTPLSAQRSYRQAMHAADGKTLSDHMDASARDSFAFTYGTNWVSRTNFVLFPKITKCTVLFTATTKFQGLEYASVFIRTQEANNPTNGHVKFQSDTFVRVQGGYMKTSDFDYSNLFGNPGQAAHLRYLMLQRYPEFLEQASKSEFPEYYYTINE